MISPPDLFLANVDIEHRIQSKILSYNREIAFSPISYEKLKNT